MKQPSVEVAALREEYTRAGLTEADLTDEPLTLFDQWFQEAVKAELVEPNAMTLATVDDAGQPWTRTVLLKAFDQRGFVFYTNYTSDKARQIDARPQVSVLFPWLPLQRQVQITGRAEKVPTRESLKYFLSRPRGSQLGAWVSAQSSVISSRQVLETKLAELKRKFGEGKVPLPDFWGGYRIVADTVEFWQGRPNRLHDRFRYTCGADGWSVNRLSP